MKPYTKVFLLRLTSYFIFTFGVSAIFILIEKGEETEDPIANIQGIYRYLNKTDQLRKLTEKDFINLIGSTAKAVCQKPNKPWNYWDSYNYGVHIVTTIGKSIL